MIESSSWSVSEWNSIAGVFECHTTRIEHSVRKYYLYYSAWNVSHLPERSGRYISFINSQNLNSP